MEKRESLTALAVSPDGGETVKTVSGLRPRTGTGLKPGVNEKNTRSSETVRSSLLVRVTPLMKSSRTKRKSNNTLKLMV